MLMATDFTSIFNVVTVIVGVVILIRLLLLAGRLVRAVEKIAEKPQS